MYNIQANESLQDEWLELGERICNLGQPVGEDGEMTKDNLKEYTEVYLKISKLLKEAYGKTIAFIRSCEEK